MLSTHRCVLEQYYTPHIQHSTPGTERKRGGVAGSGCSHPTSSSRQTGRPPPLQRSTTVTGVRRTTLATPREHPPCGAERAAPQRRWLSLPWNHARYRDFPHRGPVRYRHARGRWCRGSSGPRRGAARAGCRFDFRGRSWFRWRVFGGVHAGCAGSGGRVHQPDRRCRGGEIPARRVPAATGARRRHPARISRAGNGGSVGAVGACSSAAHHGERRGCLDAPGRGARASLPAGSRLARAGG